MANLIEKYVKNKDELLQARLSVATGFLIPTPLIMTKFCYFGLFMLCTRYTDPVYKVTLSVSNLSKSLEFWNKVLEMNILKHSETQAELAYSDNQVYYVINIHI